MTKKREPCGGTEGKPNWRHAGQGPVGPFQWHKQTPECGEHTSGLHNCFPCSGCHSCDPANWCACGKQKTHPANVDELTAYHHDGTPLGDKCKLGLAAPLMDKLDQALAHQPDPAMEAAIAAIPVDGAEAFSVDLRESREQARQKLASIIRTAYAQREARIREFGLEIADMNIFYLRERKRAESAEARVKVLEEALRPFVEHSERYPHLPADHWLTAAGITVGDLRRAAQALEAK